MNKETTVKAHLSTPLTKAVEEADITTPGRTYPLALGRRGRQRGLTLVEACVVLAIVVVMGAVAAPSLREWLGLLKPDIAQMLRSQLHLARSEAIKSGARAVMCKSADGRSCAAQGSWAQGWIVFRDTNNDAQRSEDEVLVWSVGALPGGFVFSGNGSVARYVSFEPDGRPAQTSGAFQAGTLTLCQSSSGPTHAHTLVMSATGRVRLDRASVSRCG